MPSRTDIRLTDHEYKTVLVDNDVAALCIAGYQLLGWMLIETSTPPARCNTTQLTFCKAHFPADSPDLLRLSKRLDSYIKQINSIERTRRWTALHFLLFMSVIGAGTYCVGTFALLLGRTEIIIVLFSLNSVQIIYSCFWYKRIRHQKAKEINALVAQKRKEIEDLMQQICLRQMNRY